MRRLIFSGLLIALTSYSETSVEATPTVLVEVRTSGSGMVAFSGQHLYLRVFADGTIEYDDVVSSVGVPKFAAQRSKLSEIKIKELVALLEESEVRESQGEYPPDLAAIDHVVTFDISIGRGPKPQTIKLTNFAPYLPRLKGKYPSKLLALVCELEAIRGDSVFRGVGPNCKSL